MLSEQDMDLELSLAVFSLSIHVVLLHRCFEQILGCL